MTGMEDSRAAANTRSWYERYYAENGPARNDVLRNPSALLQSAAAELSLVRALAAAQSDPDRHEVLDVGCGSGSCLLSLLKLGFRPRSLHGVDILDNRVFSARECLPHVDLKVADARALPYPDAAFDIVMESTMFVQITDDDMAARVAVEMGRVCRPGGHVVLSDWRYSKPWDDRYKGLTSSRVDALFPRSSFAHRGVFRGALVPPVGRLLSRCLPSVYFLAQGLLPLLAGQTTVLLEKRA